MFVNSEDLGRMPYEGVALETSLYVWKQNKTTTG
jgi:hypothetical protein